MWVRPDPEALCWSLRVCFGSLRLDHEAAIRISNAINRILAGLRKRHARRPKVDDQSGRPKLGLVR